MQPQDFNALVASLPIVEKVIGHDANGNAIVAPVHSLFGGVE